MKYRKRAIVTVREPSTIHKFASKTTFCGPFWGSMARGDCKTAVPVIVTEAAEVVFMLKRKISKCVSDRQTEFYRMTSHFEMSCMDIILENGI